MDEYGVLRDYLEGKGLKATRARMTVLKAFLGLERHVTAEEIHAAALRLDPGIGQATVFRTVKLLEDAGLAREAARDSDGRRYEHAWRHRHHDHLVCRACGAVVEFEDAAIERAQEAVYRRYGYASAGHRLELVGICPACASGRPRRRR